MPERVIVRTNRKELKEADNRFNQELRTRAVSKGLATMEVRGEISEHAFRKPIVIFDRASIAIRPFWRDGKQAPPLLKAKTSYQYRGHY